MGMTKGHGKAAVVIGTSQLFVAGALIIASFIFASYGTVSTSQTPYWGGFPVSIQTPEGLIILFCAARYKLNSRNFFNFLVYDEVRYADCLKGLFTITERTLFPGVFRSFCFMPLHGRLISLSEYLNAFCKG